MKIIHATWFTQMGEIQPIGIVVGEDEITGEKKAYIGTGYGRDEGSDINHIMSTGAKFHPVTAISLAKLLSELPDPASPS